MAGDGSLIIQTVIANDPWNYGNLPEAHVKLTFLEDEGFQVDMWCYETEMRAVNKEPDTPVYEDSCLECFLNFYPEESPKYLNFEVNSLGTMLCQVGTNKTDLDFYPGNGSGAAKSGCKGDRRKMAYFLCDPIFPDPVPFMERQNFWMVIK